MLDWLKGKLRWLLVVAAIAGPVFAVIGWIEIDRVNDLVARGAEADATILGATRKKGRRGGTTYHVTLGWKDAGGADRRAEEVRVSSAMAGRLFRDDRIVVDRVRVKYLADQTDHRGVVLLDDVTEELELDRIMMYGGVVIGAIGLLGCAWMFGLLARLRSRPRPEFERDGRTAMGPPAGPPGR